MKDKRGQKLESPTAHVAMFVLLLALFIVAYLVLVPKAERERLLGKGEEYYPEEYDEEEEIEKEILLSVSPGRVYPYSRGTEEKSFASINLYSTTETSPILLADNVVVTRSLFMNRYKELSFDVDNLADLENLGLFFNIAEAKGELVVIINNNEIYKGKIMGADLPVKLPSEHLKEYDNKLILKASHPGLFILSTNRFVLKDVQLIKQTRLVNKVETRSFIVDDLDSLRKGEVGFFVNCLKAMGEHGTLKISLNGRKIYIGKVVCGFGRVEQDIVKDYFVEGRNTLVFEIDKGEYVLEQVKLELGVEEKKIPQYWFSIDEKEGEYRLRMNFEESDEVKRATISVNGNNVYLDEYGNVYSKDVSDLIREGENYVKILAKNEFVIDLLEIVRK